MLSEEKTRLESEREALESMRNTLEVQKSQAELEKVRGGVPTSFIKRTGWACREEAVCAVIRHAEHNQVVHLSWM